MQTAKKASGHIIETADYTYLSKMTVLKKGLKSLIGKNHNINEKCSLSNITYFWFVLNFRV